jgi:hypothetical protein
MDFTITQDDERLRLTVKVTGTVSSNDAFRLADVVLADDPPGYARLVELDSVDIQLSSADVRTLAATASGRPSLTIAIVASNNEDAYALARMFSILTEGSRVRVEVFREPSDAERWLDLHAHNARTI